MPSVGLDLLPGRLDSPFGSGDNSGNLKIGHSSGGTNRVVYRVVPQKTATLWDVWLETRARSGPSCSPQLADADSAESSSYSAGNPNNWLWEIRFHPMKSDGSGWFDPSTNLVPAIQFNPYFQRRNTSYQFESPVYTYSALKIPVGTAGLAVTKGTPIAITVAPANGAPATDYASVNEIYVGNGREGSMARNEVGTTATDVFYGLDPRVTQGGSSADGSSQWYPGNNANSAPFSKHLPVFLLVYTDGTIHGQEYYSAASGSAPTLAGTQYTMNYKVPSATTFTHLRALFSSGVADSFQTTIAVNGVDKGTVTLTSSGANPGQVVTAKLATPVSAVSTDVITVRFTCNVQNAVIRMYANSVFATLLGQGSSYYAWLTGDTQRVIPVMPVPWPFPRLVAGSVPTGAPATPTGFTATAAANAISLAWTANSESYLMQYNIYRDGALLTSVAAGTTSYGDSVPGGTSHGYQVTAVALDTRESAKTSTQSATATTPATIAYAGERKAFTTGTASGLTLPIVLASGTTAGNTLILGVGGRNSSAVLNSISDSKGNTWTVDKQVQDVSANTFCAVASCQLTSALATSDTVTLTFASAPGPAVHAQFEEFSGLVTSSRVDQSVTADVVTTNTALSVGPTGATTQGSELAFAYFSSGGASISTQTPGSGYTAFTTVWQATTGAASNRSGGGVYKILSTIGTQTATTTVSPGTAYFACLVTYKGA